MTTIIQVAMQALLQYLRIPNIQRTYVVHKEIRINIEANATKASNNLRQQFIETWKHRRYRVKDFLSPTITITKQNTKKQRVNKNNSWNSETQYKNNISKYQDKSHLFPHLIKATREQESQIYQAQGRQPSKRLSVAYGREDAESHDHALHKMG